MLTRGGRTSNFKTMINTPHVRGKHFTPELLLRRRTTVHDWMPRP
jgi:hypothetical protein